MPFPKSLLTVIEMACTSKQQTISLIETSDPKDREEMKKQAQTEAYDEESRQFRKYLAQQEALRQLDQRKTHALAVAHRMSFIR
jgi:hypothetical protein